MADVDRVRFNINGEDYSVGHEVTSDVTLLDFIRYSAGLCGTKYMCREGGCGACIVSVEKSSSSTPLAVNSCLVSITSCHGWKITTIENVGNRVDGYHPLQLVLAYNNGTQCGYCSPGWVMTMYSLLHGKKKLKMLEIEKMVASNICRCTGYRPILEALKSFAQDNPQPNNILDIEDLTICKKNKQVCRTKCPEDDGDWCIINKKDTETSEISTITLKDEKQWFLVHEIGQIFQILRAHGYDSYMLVAGNTAKGAYPIDEYPQILIDISEITELKGFTIDQNLIIGAGNTLTELINILEEVSEQEYFKYLSKLVDHLQLVAHVAVRNLGSIAGNLMTKHQHNEFASDIFLLLETVDAFITIVDSQNVHQVISMQEFLKISMKGKVIFNILLPPLNSDNKIVTFKIMPRSLNAHAIVNAGFLYKYTDTDRKVYEARIVYGGLSSSFIRAMSTEKHLIGKDLFTNENLQSALGELDKEIKVTESLLEAPAAYRKQLAMNLFYKGLLTLCPVEKIGEKYRSGIVRLRETRPVSKARQVYDTDPQLWPLTQPIPKLEALIQCSGEAFYTEDLPLCRNEVYAAFVLSSVATGKIVSINADEALEEPGVIAFYSAKDIPGLNSFTPFDSITIIHEEVFCSGEIKFYNQPIGVIVADSKHLAERAAKKVVVTYENVKEPTIDIKYAKNDPDHHTLFKQIDATDKGDDVVHVIKYSNTIYSQLYFSMEIPVCITRPLDETIEVHTASQFLNGVQISTSQALNIDQNRVDVYTRRLGGSYGLKLSRTTQIAVACSLVAFKLNRPCRFVLPLTATSRAIGKRFPCTADFEVGVNNNGVVQYMNFDLYEDNGHVVNEQIAEFGVLVYNSCYDASKWNYKCYQGTTDTAKNTFFRSPGSLETIAMVEGIMEKISYELSLDPLEVRLSNLDLKNHKDVKEMAEYLIKCANYDERKEMIELYNTKNRWKKRGLRFSFLRWSHNLPPYFDVSVSVYYGDGSVIITHGGVEMGQGINTKAAQICAYFLKIPLEKIQVKGTNVITSPNSVESGASSTSQHIGLGVQRACEDLLQKLKPIKDKMKDATWEEIITEAYNSSIDLQAHGFAGPDVTESYDVYGVTLAEVEVDILTGETEILRVDVMEDAGQSVSPGIDVGQVEGAFVMGLGYWLTEKIVYDERTGELLTDRTWNYYVPQARDIPQDFRVYFRKNSYGKKIYLGSKSIGEPPMCMAIAVTFAIREAITSARLDSGIATTTWFDIDGPYTVDKICMATATNSKDLKFA